MDIEAKARAVRRTLRELILRGHPLVFAYSSGKDSSTVLSLGLEELRALRGQRPDIAFPPTLVLMADTTVENPEIAQYARAEIGRIQQFAAAHHIDVRVGVSVPNLNDTWAVRTISGRSLPRFPGQSHDCTEDWKVKPMGRLRKRMLAEIVGDWAEPVTLTGTRYDESRARGKKMTARGERATEVWRNKEGGAMLSPIAEWSDDDVWEYLGQMRATPGRSYSDFTDTFAIYASAAGASCAVVADMMLGSKPKNACGARFGCAVCTLSREDKSLVNMIESDGKYGYLRELNRLQRFLLATQYDMSRRSWLGRTLTNQHMAVGPDRYSPAMLDELLCYALSIDRAEAEASRLLGIDARFQLIGLEQLVLIDALWSRDGIHRPFHALKRYREVYLEGAHYAVPVLPKAPDIAIPPRRWLYVGDNWDEGQRFFDSGLSNPLLEAFAGDGCCRKHVSGKDGTAYLDIEVADTITVDPEGASLVLELELEGLIAAYHDNPSVSRTAGYRYYLDLGVLALKKGAHAEVDAILRRTAFFERNGYLDLANWQDILPRTIGNPWPDRAGQQELLL